MKRTDWVDQAKGLGILLVVLGHACVPSLVSISKVLEKTYLFIYLFHMPVFMYLSGYAFFHFSRKQSIRCFIKKKIKSLIYPYTIYLLAMYLLFRCISLIPFLNNILGVNISFNFLSITKDIVMCEGALDKHLWYIYLLYFISIWAYWVDQCKWIKYIMIVLCVLVGPILYPTNLPVIFDLPYYLPIFFLGKVDINNFVKKMPKIIKGGLFIGYMAFGVFYLSNVQWLKALGYGLIYIKYIAGYIGIIFFFICMNVVNKKYFSSVLKYIGQRSFIIYLFHQPIIVSGTALASYKILQSPVISMIISTFAGIIAPIVLEKVYRKVKDYVGKNCKKLHI